jgi:hypothetical protein
MKHIVLLVMLFVPTFATSQDNNVKIHSSTTVSPTARYQIVQSTLAARWTFRLDRVCGNIGQLVSTPNQGTAWDQMLILGQPKCQVDGKVRYQLFTSGIAARHTFLMNTETGKTWQLGSAKGKDGLEYSAWFPFED